MTEKSEEQPKEKVYLLVYSGSALGTKEQIKNCLNQIPQVISWRTDLPSAFYILSQYQTANEVADGLTTCLGKKGRFLIVQITPDTNLQGWLPPDTWHFLNRKTAAEIEAEKKKAAL
ncbi:MAG TPA: hypothetical protein VJR02_06735 [Pyrinomonadaceae bacterium]|nr:hypothetical protein [Pyrinomonadaceae bacterium]